MKTLYLECNMGAAGDMLAGALLELHPDPAGFLARLNALGLPGVAFQAETSVKCGVRGTHVRVTVHGGEEHSHDVPLGHSHEHPHDHEHPHGHEHPHDHEHLHNHEHPHGHGHHHAGMRDIQHILSHLDLPEPVREDALAVYERIAQAESHAHGVPVSEIHFHEVGTLDAVADVAAVCLLIHELAPDQVLCSPIHVGSGQVRCAHGILPVPAPATASILQGSPTYGGQSLGELCTPTGAALLRHFVQGFGPAPAMRVEKTGYGMGTKDFEAMNAVRAMLGETEDQAASVAELRCNLDDMTPESLAFAAGILLEAGALDVFTTAIGMKKGRPGWMLTCLARLRDRERLIRLLFAHTTTLGVRETLCARYVLDRSQETVHTKYGDVRVKRAQGWGVERKKPEYEDLARLARERGIPLEEARREAEASLGFAQKS